MSTTETVVIIIMSWDHHSKIKMRGPDEDQEYLFLKLENLELTWDPPDLPVDF